MDRLLLLALALMGARARAACPQEIPKAALPTWNETRAAITSEFPNGGLKIERGVGEFYSTPVCFLGMAAEEGFAFDRAGRLSRILVRFKAIPHSLRGSAQGSPEVDEVRLELEKLLGRARPEPFGEAGQSWVWATPQAGARLLWGPEPKHVDGYNLEAPSVLRFRMEARPTSDQR